MLLLGLMSSLEIRKGWQREASAAERKGLTWTAGFCWKMDVWE